MTIAKVYGKALGALANAAIDFDTDTIKVALAKAAYSPNQDTDEFVSILSTNELSGGNYSRQTLTGKTTTYDSGTNTQKLSCGNVLWTNLTAADIRYALFYKDTTVDSTSPLICYWDFETTLAQTAQDFTLSIAANGLLTLTTS